MRAGHPDEAKLGLEFLALPGSSRREAAGRAAKSLPMDQSWEVTLDRFHFVGRRPGSNLLLPLWGEETSMSQLSLQAALR